MNGTNEGGGEYQEPLDGDGLTAEQRELAAFWLPYFTKKEIPPEQRRDCEKEVAELATLLGAFEVRHSLQTLRAIIQPPEKDTPQYTSRESARLDIVPIVAILNVLKEQTNISPKRYDELYARYTQLSSAVGFINGTTVRHE